MKQTRPENGAFEIAIVFLHPACNMTCSYCATENAIDSMTMEQGRRVLDTLEERSIASVVLGGGEPFAWEHDCLDLAAEAKARGFFVQVGTNGIDVPTDFDTTHCVDRYVFPLDGPDDASHNTVRIFRDGHFALVLDRLDALRRARKSVTVSTVITSCNIDELHRIRALLADYRKNGGQLHAWHLYKFLPIGRGGRDNAEALTVTDRAYDAACSSVKETDPGFAIYKRKDMRHSKSVDFFWFEAGVLRIGSEEWV